MALAWSLALVACLAMGVVAVPLLARLKAGQSIRAEGPQRHLSKQGTPTMGGLFLVAAMVLGCLLAGGTDPEAVACLLAAVAFAAIGFTDDFRKVVRRQSLGLRARDKLLLQVLAASAFALALLLVLGRGTEIPWPLASGAWQAGWWYVPFVVLLMVGFSNAVNLTDGLDGLAAGVTAIAALGLVLVSLRGGHPGAATVSAAMGGACLGFLAFNRHPARVFMGDTGSMALGGAVASVAAVTRSELLLLVLGGVYVAEAASVIIQVASYQLTGRRVFLMSPLHHHFELKGWQETRVVRAFWVAALGCVLLALVAAGMERGW